MGCCSSKPSSLVSNELNIKVEGLLSPIIIKDYKLPNRIVHAAMTRGRCDPSNSIPNDLLVEYYTKVARNGCKFIITECSGISPENCFKGNGFCHNNQQMEGWKKVVDSVHREGAKIFLQLFHGGRANHPKNSGGITPVAPSAIAIRGKDHTIEGLLDHVEPREITKEEMKIICNNFKEAAKNAINYGFDGIQLHCANGYLIDQFIRSYTNWRKDEYGNSIENRLRFPLEIIDECIDAIGADKVGIKVSPLGRYNDMYDETPFKTFNLFMMEVNKRNIAFVEMMGPDSTQTKFFPKPEEQIGDVWKAFRSTYKGLYIANSKFDFNSGNEIISNGDADMVSFGTKFISNPDLVRRFENGLELNNKVDWGNVFFGGRKGYLDYPEYNEFITRK
jgi:N-ethylmaleimide reductase